MSHRICRRVRVCIHYVEALTCIISIGHRAAFVHFDKLVTLCRVAFVVARMFDVEMAIDKFTLIRKLTAQRDTEHVTMFHIDAMAPIRNQRMYGISPRTQRHLRCRAGSEFVHLDKLVTLCRVAFIVVRNTDVEEGH